jgi:hypothetical protein
MSEPPSPLTALLGALGLLLMTRNVHHHRF